MTDLNDRILSTVSDWTDEEFALALGFNRTETALSPRVYVTGVTLCATVNTDGSVVFEVDLSEVGDIDLLADETYSDEIVAADVLTVEDAARRLQHTIINVVTAQEAS